MQTSATVDQTALIKTNTGFDPYRQSAVDYGGHQIIDYDDSNLHTVTTPFIGCPSATMHSRLHNVDPHRRQMHLSTRDVSHFGFWCQGVQADSAIGPTFVLPWNVNPFMPRISPQVE
ncbi:hypothetical protein EAI_03863 [Harpegnathos saltator]|uniref:Uncharacterized protein n=1 Tax=Harpegnathos saltator TaxID=610380 RepID=E2BLY5_HARSA|nr:hypothetical protein EAI_03863 [Harpegnathos saltator]